MQREHHRGRSAVRILLVAAAIIGLGATVAAPLSAHDATQSLSARLRGDVYTGLARSTSGPCAGRFAIDLRGRALCTHGPDLAPPTTDVTAPRSVSRLLAEAPGSTEPSGVSPGVLCVGDGISGSRVQAIYAVAADRVDRYGTIAPLIRGYAAQMDADVVDSAAETGGIRHIAFATNPDCSLNVAHVVVSATGDDDFGATIQELAALGFDQPGRKYQVWMDANIYCGIGTVANDDSHGPTNTNDSAISYGRSDNGCWGYAELHELFHNLGGVQLSAPHSSGGWHCTDESDRMCYDDGGDVMTHPCASSHERLLDCDHDDYFDTQPATGSYLDTHWNTADSSFLWSDGVVPADPEAARPPNDDFEAAMPIAHLPSLVVVDTRSATLQPGEPTPPNGCDLAASGTVWFRHRPKVSGAVVAVTRDSTFHTTIAVYRGPSLDRLRFLGCSAGTATLQRARFRLDMVAGKRYWFQVGGYGAAAGELAFKLKRV